MSRPPMPADAERFWAPLHPDVPRIEAYRYGFIWSVNGRRYDVHETGHRFGGPSQGDYADLRYRYNRSVFA